MSEILPRVGRWARANWAILLPAFIYLSLFPYLPALRSPNELCRLHQTRALVDHGTFEINDILREQGPIGDLSCVAVARQDGQVVERRPCPEVRGQPRFAEEHYFPSKAPLLSVAAVPVYAALKALRSPLPVGEVPLVFFARLFATLLPALLLLIPLRRYLRVHLPEPLADALTATYALGTLAFSYSELFMSHQTTAVLVFACFYALFRLSRGEWPRWGYLVAGMLAGLTVAAEYTGALALVPLAAYGLAVAPGNARGKLSAVALALLGVLPVAILLALYHQAAFGGPLDSGYKYLNDAAYQGWHRGGFLGVKLPDLRALFLSFFSPLRGLFALSPFLLLALPGLRPSLWPAAARKELALSARLLVFYAYFTASFSYDSWGWTTGPRHLTPLVPFLLLPAGRFVESLGQKLAAGAAAGLAALSIFATSAMTFLNYIPDSLTNALWQVALPFLSHGYLPQTVFSLLGVPNPWAALPVLLAVAAAMALVVRAIAPAPAKGLLAAAAAAFALVCAIHAAARPYDEASRARDQGTYTFLMERFLPSPGRASPPFWGR